jgi:hypothetical protein
MWERTPFDVPENQLFGVHSDRDKQFWSQLQKIMADSPHSMTHVLAHWQVYVKRVFLTRFLAHHELFRKTVDLPGSIVDLGVSRGISFFTWHKLLEIFSPTDTTKKVYGFDSCEGLTDFSHKDGTSAADDANDKRIGGWSVDAGEAELFALVELFNRDNILARERSRLIKGRIQDTLDPFLQETPGLRISLLHFDMDLYEPTLFGLRRLWDLVVPGGLVVLDQYALPPWGGEGAAFDEFVAERGLRVELRKLPWALNPTAYVVK